MGVLTVSVSASAMDRWAALSMLESGDNDRAIGSHGEISRFQIRPSLWRSGDPQDALAALTTAQKIMQARLHHFKVTHQREAMDFEFYVLWNAPWQVNHPSAVVSERARRFVNLVRSD